MSHCPTPSDVGTAGQKNEKIGKIGKINENLKFQSKLNQEIILDNCVFYTQTFGVLKTREKAWGISHSCKNIFHPLEIEE